MSAPDTLASVGESAALQRIFPRLPHASATLLGPGDDAAVIAAPDGRFVVTTDMMIHGPDFRLAWSSPFDLGWKAAASNLSDVAAMGAVPTALVVALALPADTPVSVLEEIAEGLRAACDALAPGCGVVGGDLSVSPIMTFAVTAFGDLEGRRPVIRSGARPGDVVAVSGALGEAAEGLRVLFTEGVDDHGEPDATRAEALRARTRAQRRPTPPIADGPHAAAVGATAMLDLSDGLAKDAARVAVASGVAIDFDSTTLGPDVALALGGGEDHSLLATFPPGLTLPGGFRAVGRVREGAGVLLDGEPAPARGWDPYRGWDGQAG
ncbi:thiamine-phosphate kinase [Salinibacterium sp. dk2585]|uniref:thiamine-phosphate kinase n=1 Tax=unclassified Salinibacterium TaxID=2632331 RepID=UPI0011C24B2A|nr:MULTISPECIES: thiamine-phosphate kinase [unclassified Salinibacterium]QEE60953.1 thiamine-phosphate kinase [Salinibacterium sp. dk2585]TXK56024.1 thiamine-phosphate kinase [Salinibacterium sp. dk5596]